MPAPCSTARDGGLARSCAGRPAEWIRSAPLAGGIERLEARLVATAYARHRHDTYGIGLTLAGAQRFGYRGAGRLSLPGEIVVLHPDEAHDGRAGSAAGFAYRILYVPPALIAGAAPSLGQGLAGLPFVAEVVGRSPRLRRAIRAAFEGEAEPLAIDELLCQLTLGLIEGDRTARPRPAGRIAWPALARARDLLDAVRHRMIASAELEQAAGLGRYELARQFRAAFGTSPYRYHLARRLDQARGRLAAGAPLAEIALQAGFFDQAHLTRRFKAAFGLTPARYGRLLAAAS